MIDSQFKNTGVIAGTLVHTKEGLKPIEQIKVGDLVLTRQKNGEGELCYQPVTRTFEYEHRELYYVTWQVDIDRPGGEPAWEHGEMAVTGGHPIWVSRLERVTRSKSEDEKHPEGKILTEINNWMTIEELYLQMWKGWWTKSKDFANVIHAVIADGRPATIRFIQPILQSLGQAHIQRRDDLALGRLLPNPVLDEFLQIPEEDVGVAFNDSEVWREEAMGNTIVFGPRGAYHAKKMAPMTAMWDVDTGDYDYTGYDTESPMSVVKRSGGHLPMRRTVYNLEVATTHSYFVGDLGLWVHNTCSVDASKAGESRR